VKRFEVGIVHPQRVFVFERHRSTASPRRIEQKPRHHDRPDHRTTLLPLPRLPTVSGVFRG